MSFGDSSHGTQRRVPLPVLCLESPHPSKVRQYLLKAHEGLGQPQLAS